MSVELIKRSGNKYVFEVEIELDECSMLNSEEQIQNIVNDLGKKSTALALETFDTKGSPIVKDDKNLSQKGKQKKNTKRPTGQ